MLGQRASSQIVTSPPSRMRLLTWKYCEFALGARTFIHSGRLGRSATGSDLFIATWPRMGQLQGSYAEGNSCPRIPLLRGTSLGGVVPEATLERTEHGSRPVSEGWFVV